MRPSDSECKSCIALRAQLEQAQQKIEPEDAATTTRQLETLRSAIERACDCDSSVGYFCKPHYAMDHPEWSIITGEEPHDDG